MSPILEPQNSVFIMLHVMKEGKFQHVQKHCIMNDFVLEVKNWS